MKSVTFHDCLAAQMSNWMSNLRAFALLLAYRFRSLARLVFRLPSRRHSSEQNDARSVRTRRSEAKLVLHTVHRPNSPTAITAATSWHASTLNKLFSGH